MGECKYRIIETDPWDCTIAEEGRNPRNTSPTDVSLIILNWMQKQMTTPMTKAITNISNARSPFIEPLGR